MGDSNDRTSKTKSVDIIIGARVRQRRETIKITQGELGEAVGLSWRDIDGMETGEDRIGAAQLIRLARALEAPISHFFVDASEASPAVPARPHPTIQALQEMWGNAEGRRLLEAYARIPPGRARQLLAEIAVMMADGRTETPGDKKQH